MEGRRSNVHDQRTTQIEVGRPDLCRPCPAQGFRPRILSDEPKDVRVRSSDGGRANDIRTRVKRLSNQPLTDQFERKDFRFSSLGSGFSESGLSRPAPSRSHPSLISPLGIPRRAQRSNAPPPILQASINVVYQPSSNRSAHSAGPPSKGQSRLVQGTSN